MNDDSGNSRTRLIELLVLEMSKPYADSGFAYVREVRDVAETSPTTVPG